MIPTLHAFQADLFDRVRARRADGKRIIVVQAATGAGKTTWASFVIKEAVSKAKRVLAIVHRRKLVDQISSRLVEFQVDHDIFMRGEKFGQGTLVTVASRDTVFSRCVRNEWVGMPAADLVIVDEAHHAHQNSEYRPMLDQYPNATILLLTATPVGPGGEGLGPWAEAIECALPTTELVKQGYLCPMKCICPRRERKGKRYVKGLAGDLVETWMEFGERRPTVLFCGRVKHSQDAVEAYAAEGIKFVHIDADTPDYDRDRAFDDLAQGNIAGISNVGIVGEGVDVPEIGCVQLFCEMGGRVRFLQACGRGMRRPAGKDYGILLDHAGACFRHGFPDEDTKWTLLGNVDQEFKDKHEKGDTEKAFYCKNCQLAYHGQQECPQCGRMPVKPPRSIFMPPAVEVSREHLEEAERNGTAGEWSRESKIAHWLRCLGVAANRNGPFSQAGVMYKKKYGEFPPRNDDFPCIPKWNELNMKVADRFPNFRRRKRV